MKKAVIVIEFDEKWMEGNDTNLEQELGWLTQSGVKIVEINEGESK